MKALILTLCLCVLVMEVYSSCGRFSSDLPRPPDGACLYEGQTILNGQTKRMSSKCLDCTCTNGELGCCGYGQNAGVFELPAGCVLDTSVPCAVVRFVMENNPSETCADS